jgi:hypothetical protein
MADMRESTSVQTIAVDDEPMCTCCTPPQPLEAASEGYYLCPVTAKRYEYDLAVGGAARQSRRANVTTEGRTDFFPGGNGSEAPRTIDATRERFA